MALPKSRLNRFILLASVVAAALGAWYLPTLKTGDQAPLSPQQQLQLEQKKQAQRAHFGRQEN